jgi:pimeloyl-ACP methyl ester carboxylesterase
MALPPPVIVVPGITATSLVDQYPLPPEIVWSVLTKEYERIRLHPDNIKFEANQPARLVAAQILEIAYKDLVNELRHNLSEREDKPVPVYPFGYDWRQNLEVAETELGEFVKEVIARTKLMRHYADDDYARNPVVNLVGHSMGGLIIAGYLASAVERGEKPPVSKVATLASPFRGSFEVIIKTVTGTADLGTSAPSSREREAARVTPGLYYLVPSMTNGLEIDDGLSAKSLFDPDLWQPNILKTIGEYVRLYAVDPGRKSERDKQAEELFKAMLDAAKQHRNKLESFKLQKAGLKNADWLAVVGVDSETRVRLAIEKGAGGKPEFNLQSSDRKNLWSSKPPATGPDNRYLTGDGTVPFEGAVPGFLTRENLVCVSPGDYGYWEIKDRLLTQVGGFHGILPNMNLVHRLVVRHFLGSTDRHGNTWGRRAPGVSKQAWDPAIANLEDKTEKD